MRNAEAPDMRADAAQQTLERFLQIDLLRLLSWLRSGAKWIILAMLLGALLGVAYTVFAKPRYTVTTGILIDPAGLQVVNDDLFRQGDQRRDSELLSLESKRQTLVSRSVLLRVVQSLELGNDPEFVPPASWTSNLNPRRLLGGGGEGLSPELIALDSLQWRVSARRDELSFVIIMSVWTNDSAKSIRISEAILKAFKEELVASNADGSRRIAEALATRIAELKSDVSAAEKAVEEFRRQAGLQSAQGELVSSRSMSQINQQLVAARERLIGAQSRYDDLVNSNSTDVVAMQSPTIAALRTQYATLKSRLDADSQIYGPRHPRLSQARMELQALQSEIDNEKQRIVQAAKNNLDQAKSMVAALEAEAAAISSDVFADNDAQVRLRDLTREAAARTSIYEAFMVRARQITESQDLDTSNIRVISPPVPPQARSWPPRTVQMAVFGAIAGFVAGIFLVLAHGIWAQLREPARGERASEPAPAAPGPIVPGPIVPGPAGAKAAFETDTEARRRAAREKALLNLRSNALLAYANDGRP